MSVFDQWQWGYCRKCEREIVLTPEGRLLVHSTSNSFNTTCPGGGEKPAPEPEELTADGERERNGWDERTGQAVPVKSTPGFTD